MVAAKQQWKARHTIQISKYGEGDLVPGKAETSRERYNRRPSNAQK